MTTGWKLDQACREGLLAIHPPVYQRTIADHVTLLANHCGGTTAAPPAPVRTATIVGRVDDGAGVEAMVVAINGSTGRPDGGTWHITWSLGEDRAARESNDALAALEWNPLEGRAVTLHPARW